MSLDISKSAVHMNKNTRLKKDKHDDENLDDVDYELVEKFSQNYVPTKGEKITFLILGILALCGFKSIIASEFAFYPPHIIGYTVDEDKFMYGSNHFLQGSMNKIMEDHGFGINYSKLTKGKDEIAAILLYKKPLDLNKQLILFSHGNGIDLGYSFHTHLNLLTQTDANVMAYDYSGYGYSNKKPSEKKIYKNIKMVYDYLTNELEVNPMNIILYGHSIGSCACSYLMTLKNVKVGGCILQSPLASGIKLIFPFQKKYIPWLDVFKNYEKLKKASVAPFYIMHGKKDEDVPYHHSIILLNSLKENFENKRKNKKNKANSSIQNIDNTSLIKFWGVANSDHNNMELMNYDSFYRRFREFLLHCRHYNSA
ncbi:hypothetical protein, conserved [Plasmodium gonderi]|uniref:Serine aminopeptidase S33 domain-containing protein n=1 Tax=Plasmodium gonderi TaxID=77519 RepID=A0A1Y1JJJ7_PLAGO|nr:hypothetical protein, conserved [Plasmodium gonderi]GAW80972.1 hypothetical protein, conserved [Plasmodium gonderi]